MSTELTPDPPDYDITKALRNRLQRRLEPFALALSHDRYAMTITRGPYPMKRSYMGPSLQFYYRWVIGGGREEGE